MVYPSKDERNYEIYDDWKRGIGIVELVKKYHVTQSRLYAIINLIKREGKDDLQRQIA